MPNITSKEQNNTNEVYNAPKKCIQNVLAYAKALKVETLSTGTKVEIVLN